MTEKAKVTKTKAGDKDDKAYEKAVKAVLKDYKKAKEITNEELVDKVVKPFALKSAAVDELMQRLEDNGISVVDENGDPAERSLKKEKAVTKKKSSATCPPQAASRSTTRCACT